MLNSIENSIVKILGSGGIAEGTGFLVSKEGKILTCSHVIWAEGKSKSPLPEEVNVIFLHDKKEERMTASVLKEFWRPWDNGDIAVLQLKGKVPEGCKHLRLGIGGAVHDHKFDTWGFPKINKDGGMPATGTIVKKTTFKTFERVVLDCPAMTSGFSGAPIVLKGTDVVIGMALNVALPDQHSKQGNLAFAITAAELTKACPDLKENALSLSDDQGNLFSKPLKKSSTLSPKAHIFCNREKQTDQFKTNYLELYEKKFNKPGIYFVHGKIDEELWDFAERVQIKVVEKHLTTLFNEQYAVPLVIKPEIKKFHNAKIEYNYKLLKDDIAGEVPGQLEPGWSFSNLFELESLKNYKTIIIQHTIFGEDWNIHTERLLDRYMQELCNSTIGSNSPHFIFFIHITYPMNQKKSLLSSFFKANEDKHEIERYLEKLSVKYGITSGLIDKLTSVTPVDVLKWIKNHNIEKDPKSIVEDIFKDKNDGKVLKAVPMGKVKKVLKNIVEDEITNKKI